MSLDINALVKAVKQAALDAVNASAPMALCFGQVTSVSPLKITVDQKKVLSEAQLILTDAVRDYSVYMTTLPEYHMTETAAGGSGEGAYDSHAHKYQGKKQWRMHNALEIGEKVILLRCDGGQRYIVLDRWEART